MGRKKRADMHVARNTEDATDAVINRVLAELRQEDGMEDDVEEPVARHKKSSRFRITAVSVIILVIVSVSFLFVHLQTYTSYREIAFYEYNNDGSSGYRQFAEGVLRYSKDGISFVNRKGQESWNQPYQIKNPVIDTYYDKAAVVADKGGNSIVVLDKNGLKGEIQTTLPIEKAAVSAQGIVCTILKNGATPSIICYDATGNVLVELATSLTGTGYPLDISISEDGKLLLVSYLGVQSGQLVTRVKYYNFEGEKISNQDYEVAADDYEGMAAGTAFFMNEKTSVVVGDDRLLLYSGEGAPKLTKTIELDKKIKSVFHSEHYVGLVLKNGGRTGYELCLFNISGDKVLSEEFSGDYSNVKIAGGQVLMYDGKKCSVFTRTGIHKFDGQLGSNILEIFPALGVNKYIMMNANGMEVIRFVK